MATTARVLIGIGSIGVLVAAGLAIGPVAARPGPTDGPRAATARLVADADGALRIHAGFVGAPAGVAIENPAVTSSTPVAAAATAHLARYGAVLGDTDPGTSFTRQTVGR